MALRKESDFLGSVDVPGDAYYGVFTVRAMRNFKISGIPAPKHFIRSLAILKRACALANTGLGLLDKKTGAALVNAAEEVEAGKFSDQFPLDIYQAGAGTPYNMNMNEVLSNRALEIMGHPKGKYDIVNPNNHANMSQSSNDVIPTASRIAVLYALGEMLPAINRLEKALAAKGNKFSGLIKTGRTHYQDAVPITLGQEFEAYANRVGEAKRRIERASDELRDLGIGGTAIGTGINTHPDFSQKVVKTLNEFTGFELRAAKDKIDKTQNLGDLLSVSNSLRMLCIDLLKISDDLKLLNSGPNAGIAELVLPEVEPGSSIMPGKVNPSIPECLDMVCFQVIGRDQANMLAASRGVLELNVYTPLIMYNLLDSCALLKNASEMFSGLCIDGAKPNEKKMREGLENGLIIGTALNPKFGYGKVAEWVKEAGKKGKTLRQVVLESGAMNEKELDKALQPQKLTKPNLEKKN